jgi:hypothetical protein
MSDEQGGLSHHPSPQRGRAGGWALGFATLGAPLAWFVQLNANYALLAQPCFPGPERNIELPADAAWTWPAALGVYALCLIIALAALATALRLFRRTRDEDAEHQAEMQEAGAGRTRFLAYWGILLGIGFAVVIFVNLLALVMVPPCVQ